ncbi:MAG: hypothetical protein AB7N76_09140 [Planctomycetota bacterium]
MSATDPPPASGQPRPFELHRAPPAEAGRSRLLVGTLALVGVGLLLLALLAGRGLSALTLGSLVVEPGVGLGPLRFGQANVAEAERYLGQGHDDSVQRSSTQSFGPGGAGPKVHGAVASMAYRSRGVTLQFSALVDESFDQGDPAHQEMFARFRRLERAPLSSVEVRGKGVATTRGLRVGDTFEVMLEKHGAPARYFPGRRETRYLYPEGLRVEVETAAGAKVVRSLSVSPPIDPATLDQLWRVYQPEPAR